MRSDTTVRDVMHREFLGVNEGDVLADAARLMVAESADCVVVLRGGRPVGRLSARDALGAFLDGDDEARVADAMTETSPTIEADERLSAAEELLVSEGASRLVVTTDGDAAGVLTERDALAAGATHGGSREFETAAAAGSGVAGSGMAAAESVDDDRSSESFESAERPNGAATQSICEACGSLAPSLSASNGTLLCADCLEV